MPGQRRRTSKPLHEAGVFGFKCFLLDSGVEEFGHLEPEEFALAMKETARIGALMIVHAEDGHLLDEVALDGTHYAGFLASRPKAAEEAAIGLVIEQARATGGRAHVVHLSDADAVPALRAARAAGVDVSVETCPHYLTFDAEHIADGATELKCCPPIREAANREALWAALGRRRHRPRRLRPLAVHRRPQAAGRRRLRRGLGRHRVGPARAARGVDRRPRARPLRSPTWCAGWPPRRPTGSG